MQELDFTGLFDLKPEPIKVKESESIPVLDTVLKTDQSLIKNPSHYKINLKDGREVEVVDIIKAVLTEEEFKGFVKGNAIKYNLRAGKKGNELQDLMKAKEVLSWLEEDL